eukprot:scaffold1611_cov307-Pinguiococcus_pyrenoidosus.AAC.7
MTRRPGQSRMLGRFSGPVRFVRILVVGGRVGEIVSRPAWLLRPWSGSSLALHAQHAARCPAHCSVLFRIADLRSGPHADGLAVGLVVSLLVKVFAEDPPEVWVTRPISRAAAWEGHELGVDFQDRHAFGHLSPERFFTPPAHVARNGGIKGPLDAAPHVGAGLPPEGAMAAGLHGGKGDFPVFPELRSREAKRSSILFHRGHYKVPVTSKLRWCVHEIPALLHVLPHEL